MKDINPANIDDIIRRVTVANLFEDGKEFTYSILSDISIRYPYTCQIFKHLVKSQCEEFATENELDTDTFDSLVSMVSKWFIMTLYLFVRENGDDIE